MHNIRILDDHLVVEKWMKTKKELNTVKLAEIATYVCYGSKNILNEANFHKIHSPRLAEFY